MSLDFQQAAETIRRKKDELAETIVARLYERQPELWKTFDDPARQKSVRDAGYHLAYLAESLAAADPALFKDYLAWVKVLFAGLKFSDEVLPATIEQTRRALQETLDPALLPLAVEHLEAGLRAYHEAVSETVSFFDSYEPLADLARRYLHALLQGERSSASRMILSAVHQGVSIRDIYLHVFQRSQREIGRLWQTNQISVAQEHYCTAATQVIMSQLYPYIFVSERRGRRMVAACVGGELHEIGARMVADFFEMGGWDTYFLGANTPTDAILRTVEERQADLLAISATMTFHVEKAAALIAETRRAGLGARVRIMVGGYPFNIAPNLWRAVGADGYARDAQQAVIEAERLARSA